MSLTKKFKEIEDGVQNEFCKIASDGKVKSSKADCSLAAMLGGIKNRLDALAEYLDERDNKSEE